MKKFLSILLLISLLATTLFFNASALNLNEKEDDKEFNVTDIFGKVPASVTYCYSENDTETVEGVYEDDLYLIDRLPKSVPNGKYFVGYYTSPDFSSDPVSSIVLTSGENKLYAAYSEYPGVKEYDFSYTEKSVFYPVVNENGYFEKVNRYTSGYGYWDFENGVATHSHSANWTQNSIITISDQNGIAVKLEPDSCYKVTLDVMGSDIDREAFAADHPNITYSDTTQFNIGAGIEYTFENGNYYIDVNSPLYFIDGTSGSGSISVESDNQWHTVTAYFRTTTFAEGVAPVFAIKSNLKAFPTEVIDGVINYYTEYGSPTTSFKNIKIENISTTKPETTVIDGKSVKYSKIANTTKDKTVYKVMLRIKTSDKVPLSFMTAEESSILENQGFVEAPNFSAVNSSNYGYDISYTTYICTDHKGGEIGHGKALYLYWPAEYENFEVFGCVITELTNKDGGALVGNGGVSMIKTDDPAAEQALRYYFNYNTSTGKNLYIDGNTYAITSRGFLMTDGGRFADEAITRENAKTNSKIVDYNVTGNDLKKCWKVELGEDSVNTLTFSTYVKDFLAEDGTYNQSKQLYVKGYIVVNINNVEYTFYSSESSYTVKDVADKQNYHDQGDFESGEAAPVTREDGRVLVWNKEFNTDGVLGGLTLRGGASTPNQELKILKTLTNDDTIYVKDGNLVLRMYQNEEGQYVTAHCPTTKNNMVFKYGYVEMRAKVPFTTGRRGSFWMQPDTNLMQGDIFGEIDIFEHMGWSDRIFFTLHKWSYPGFDEHCNMDSENKAVYEGDCCYIFPDKSNLVNEYHIYGFEWTEEYMKLYIDGYCYYTIYISEEDDFSTTMPGMECFHDYYHLIWGNWLNESYAAEGNYINTDAEYAIDYVRIYQYPETEDIKLY